MKYKIIFAALQLYSKKFLICVNKKKEKEIVTYNSLFTTVKWIKIKVFKGRVFCTDKLKKLEYRNSSLGIDMKIVVSLDHILI